jgi:hypothetical protein
VSRIEECQEGPLEMSLNRRDFIGGAVATAAAPFIGTAAQSIGQPRKGWTRNGLIDAGGSHEPYLFTVRRGGQRMDAKQTVDYHQSEPLIRRLRDNGVEVFHTHFYKGFGMEAEREEMEQTRKAVELAHRLGMKADLYIQWSTLMYETFFVEQPKAVNWIQRDISGLPILLPYGYQQSFRYRPCFANQEYLDYLKQIVRHAITNVKGDFIHFDNFDLNAEPDSCHCPHCVTGFRNRLRKKYSSQQLRDRFGFECVDYVNPPQWNRSNPPEHMQIIYDPAFQEWADFRCQVMADALGQMADLASELNGEVALEINPAGITGQNRAWNSGIDHSRLLTRTKSFWSEEENTPSYHPDGRLISKIRSYKLARAYSNILLTYVENDPLALGEDLAFNQTLGFVGSGQPSPTTKDFIEFYRRFRECYVDSEDVANVAVLRPFASLTYNNADVQLCTVLVEQALIQSRIPFNYLFDDGWSDLEKYAAIILPNSECLSDGQLDLLRRYVEDGGALIVIGQAGMYDEWRRVRIIPGLKGLVDEQPAAQEYQQSVTTGRSLAVPVAKKQVRRGRVAFLRSMEFDGTVPPSTPYFEITNQYWKRPKNWKDLEDAVIWATGDRLPIQVEGPDFLIANCTSHSIKRTIYIHFVNYNVSRVPVLNSIAVSVALPDALPARRVTLYAPGNQEARTVEFTHVKSSVGFAIPEVRAYAFAAVEW